MPVPGPVALGRGVVVTAGAPVPAPWAGAPVVTIDEATLEDPGPAVAALHDAWATRTPVVIALGVDARAFRAPVDHPGEPWRFTPDFEPWFDRLQFLVWANTYDARNGEPVWWWARKAERLGGATATADGDHDVVLADGCGAWIDGGPRGPLDVGAAVVHRESVEAGSLAVVPQASQPAADLAPDQLAAVAHGAGPARIVAPAGSGKTRVLTERLRHLMVDRGYERGSLLAVAYNKKAQLELEERSSSFRPRVQTLNALGYALVAEHRGRAPRVLEEREVRRIVEKLVEVRRRRSNTDPIAPYVEALSLVRLALRDPEEVEAERDDVPGLAEAFPRFRRELAGAGAVDFDEQVYAAVQALLSDGAFRQQAQAGCRHLLVDEFQDLTPAHVLMLRLLAAPGYDVFGVGDDDQCIYGHAGADPRFLVDFERLFPGAASHPLEVNYRCPVEVVDGARNLLGYNRVRVAKEIRPGPAADPSDGALVVRSHDAEAGASAVVDVVQRWLAQDGVAAADLAVLARVNALLLAPQVALREVGVPVVSALRPEVLERTGIRAALAYLRIGADPGRIDGSDVVEILRRPTRGLPQWFPDRLRRKGAWNLRDLRGLGARVPDKDAEKVDRLVDDLELVTRAVSGGTTRGALVVIRDRVGLGKAMSLLDGYGGEGSSHLDDLEALMQVADLHPDPSTFEPWLRSVLAEPGDEGGVTLSTVHRVKGMEWDRVAVFGVNAGIVPHRLSEDVEEERRVLHVAVTRGRHRVVVLADSSRPSPFLDELSGEAPPPEERRVRAAAAPRAQPSTPALEAAVAVRFTALGNYEGEVTEVSGEGVRLRLEDGGTLFVRYGEQVTVDGRRLTLARSVALDAAGRAAEDALRAWRLERSKRDGVPAFVVLSDKYLKGIAAARPADLEALLRCDGIGPTKLDLYGEEILDVLAATTPP